MAHMFVSRRAGQTERCWGGVKVTQNFEKQLSQHAGSNTRRVLGKAKVTSSKDKKEYGAIF